jgi:hypothetical protein
MKTLCIVVVTGVCASVWNTVGGIAAGIVTLWLFSKIRS